uniref:NADH-ubiquinone oxidoreductase chain 2 n=1 Tax=Eleutherodactylus pipilans TaxID=228426 RepID=Q53EF8_9NEOB|nr:NADH dehydrogenase subunit II [Eleutherodactylus pipilans]
MNPHALSMIVSSLALGTITTLSSYHWILAWIGLEINTLAIIPLMTKPNHPRAIEAATKYFLMQATASAMILFSSTANAFTTGEWNITSSTNNLSTMFMSIALLTKIGVAPFHFWLPEVMQGLSIKTGLLLSTWQKLAPLALLVQLQPSINSNLMMLTAMLSMMVGGWGGINQTQTRKVLAYSSIAHLGWMVAVLKFLPQLTILNFILYVTVSSTLFLLFIQLNTKNIFELSTSWPKMPALTALSILTLLSLGGLPPLTGFIPKWMITNELIKQHLTLFSLVILLMTLLTLFFYLQLAYSMSLVLAPNTSFSQTTWPLSKKNTMATLISLSMLLLPLTPGILAIT